MLVTRGDHCRGVVVAVFDILLLGGGGGVGVSRGWVGCGSEGLGVLT